MNAQTNAWKPVSLNENVIVWQHRDRVNEYRRVEYPSRADADRGFYGDHPLNPA